MLEALFGQAKTLFGKTFLIAGILPAALFVLGMKWYLSGSLEAVALLISESLAEPGKLTAGAIFGAGELLAVSLVLFASRSFVFNLVEHVPGRPLFLLRRFLTARQRRQYRRSLALQDTNAVKNDASLWYLENFDKLNVSIRDSRNPSLEKILKESIKARELVSSDSELLREGRAYDVKEKHLEQVAGSLYSLYVFVHKRSIKSEQEPVRDKTKTGEIETKVASETDMLASEIEEWKAIAADEVKVGYFDLLATFARRQLNESIFATMNYPEKDVWLRPTAFGNRLSALDDYAQARYGISTGTLWPRLWRILSPEERSEISDKQLLIEAHLNFSVVFLAMLAFVVISSAITTGRTFWEFGFDVSRDWLSIGFSASTLLLAYISYYGAIFALGSFSESIKSLVDLRCLQLLPALGYLPPFTIKKEIKLFNELDSFFVSSSQRIDRQLVPPAAPKSDSDKKKEASE